MATAIPGRLAKNNSQSVSLAVLMVNEPHSQHPFFYILQCFLVCDSLEAHLIISMERHHQVIRYEVRCRPRVCPLSSHGTDRNPPIPRARTGTRSRSNRAGSWSRWAVVALRRSWTLLHRRFKRNRRPRIPCLSLRCTDPRAVFRPLQWRLWRRARMERRARISGIRRAGESNANILRRHTPAGGRMRRKATIRDVVRGRTSKVLGSRRVLLHERSNSLSVEAQAQEQ